MDICWLRWPGWLLFWKAIGWVGLPGSGEAQHWLDKSEYTKLPHPGSRHLATCPFWWHLGPSAGHLGWQAMVPYQDFLVVGIDELIPFEIFKLEGWEGFCSAPSNFQLTLGSSHPIQWELLYCECCSLVILKIPIYKRIWPTLEKIPSDSLLLWPECLCSPYPQIQPNELKT